MSNSCTHRNPVVEILCEIPVVVARNRKIKTYDDSSFYSCIGILKQPYLNPRLVLQESEDQIDRLCHHLLNSRTHLRLSLSLFVNKKIKIS